MRKNMGTFSLTERDIVKKIEKSLTRILDETTVNEQGLQVFIHEEISNHIKEYLNRQFKL